MIDILLATYNGEKYIENQILSIIAQSYKNWNLIIHDDGSTDNTISIIKKWISIDSRIKLIEDEVQFGNAAKNFMHLLKYVNSEFIMFCDQDDIWINNKVELMLGSIKEKQNNIPQIVYSRSYVWKENGIETIIPDYYPIKLKDFLFLNYGINGCFAIFNKAALTILKNQSYNLAMHDHLLQLVGICFGEIHYMKQPLMLYRRHSTTVTSGDVKFSLSPVKKLISNKKIAVIDKAHYETVKLFFQTNESMINKKDKDKILSYLSFPYKSLLTKIIIVIWERFTIRNSLYLLIKIIVRPIT